MDIQVEGPILCNVWQSNRFITRFCDWPEGEGVLLDTRPPPLGHAFIGRSYTFKMLSLLCVEAGDLLPSLGQASLPPLSNLMEVSHSK